MYLPLLALAVVAYLAHSAKKSEPSSPVAPGPGGTPPPKDPAVPSPDYPNIPGDFTQPSQPKPPAPPALQYADSLGSPVKPGSEMRATLRDNLRGRPARFVRGVGLPDWSDAYDATLLMLVPKSDQSMGLLGVDALLNNAAAKNQFLVTQMLPGDGRVAEPRDALDGRLAEVFVHESGQYIVSRMSPPQSQPLNLNLPITGTWWLVAQYPGFNVLPSDSIAEDVSDWFEDNF